MEATRPPSNQLPTADPESSSPPIAGHKCCSISQLEWAKFSEPDRQNPPEETKEKIVHHVRTAKLWKLRHRTLRREGTEKTKEIMRDRMKSQNQHPRPAPPARRTSKNRRSKKKGNQKKKKKAKLDPRATFLKRTKLPYMRTYSFRFHFHSNHRHRHNYQQTPKKTKSEKFKAVRSRRDLTQNHENLVRFLQNFFKSSEQQRQTPPMAAPCKWDHKSVSFWEKERKKPIQPNARICTSPISPLPEISNQGQEEEEKSKKKENKQSRTIRTSTEIPARTEQPATLKN